MCGFFFFEKRVLFLSVSVSHRIQQQSTLKKAFPETSTSFTNCFTCVRRSAVFLSVFRQSGPGLRVLQLLKSSPVVWRRQRQVSETSRETSAVDGLQLIPSLKGATPSATFSVPHDTAYHPRRNKASCGHSYNLSDCSADEALYFATRNCSVKNVLKRRHFAQETCRIQSSSLPKISHGEAVGVPNTGRRSIKNIYRC